MRRLTRIIARVLDKATVSVIGLSEAAGHHSSTLGRLKCGAREATPEVARDLADAMREHAERLEELANELDEAADEAEGG